MGAGQSSNKITSHDKAILDLKHQRDKLKQYQKRLEINIDNHSGAAKAALTAGQKSRALTALRQRKYEEQLLTKTDSQLSTLQELLSSIEFTQIQTKVIQSLSNGATVLKELQKELSLDKVESVMDRVADGVMAQREIDEALMSKISPEEEEACQAELAALEAEALGTAAPGVKATPALENEAQRMPQLPDAPSGELEDPVEERAETARKQQQREEDLRVAMAA